MAIMPAFADRAMPGSHRALGATLGHHLAGK